MDQPFDAVVIGTGFAGAVTACRLVQAGLRICLLERGRRFEADDLPVYGAAFERSEEPGDADLSRLAWPFGGVWDVRDLRDAVVVQAAGYGGGSLIYANVHLRAPRDLLARWPAPYRELDAYYDLAAFMLQVAPMPQTLLPRKSQQLRRAAEACRGTDGGPVFSFFRPPLAVRFAADGAALSEANRWGRTQGTCNLCGECCFGCSRRARHTLDTNYLAIVEDARDAAGRALADIRTRAEVVAIRCCTGDGDSSYEVDYDDHCFSRNPSRRRILARRVFLCAGAVNTTELMLKARASKALRPTGSGLGGRFCGNADAPAVIFDCEELQESARGPTIGGAILHRSGNDWLMIQEGGLPGALEPWLGVYRSPLAAGRNRFRESRRDQGRRERREPAPQPLAFASLPFGDLRAILAELERSSRSPRSSLANVMSAELHRLAGGATSRSSPWGLPEQLLRALGSARDELAATLSAAAEPLVDRFLSRTAQTLESNPSLKSFFDGLTRSVPGAAGKRALERQFLRLVIQQVWGSEAGLIHDVVSFALGELLAEPEAAFHQISNAVCWALDHRLGDGHTAILLSMGRDRTSGSLALDASERLVATLPSRLDAPETALQERLLRDLAAVGFEGELRTNPAWTLVDRRITVHAQGGCPMGESPEGAVTAVNGEVFGCPGLFVMDAAGFPTPVGVNPSATVAAVAEYKIERFLRTLPGREGWTAPELEEARRWAGARQHDLDPLAALDEAGGHALPASRPIGIAFEERMEGFHGPIGGGRERGAYREAEKEGIRSAATLEMRLDAEVEDLSDFLLKQERYEQQVAASHSVASASYGPPQISVRGEVRIRGAGGSDATEQRLEVLGGSAIALTAADERGDRDAPQRCLSYRLLLGGSERPRRLEGRKLLRDDPRLDAFEDSTTLFFDLLEDGVAIRRGVLRLPAQVFLGVQLPSFRATNTNDPVREAWALAAFGHFFLGRLAQVYLPGVRGLAPLLGRSARRLHV